MIVVYFHDLFVFIHCCLILWFSSCVDKFQQDFISCVSKFVQDWFISGSYCFFRVKLLYNFPRIVNIVWINRMSFVRLTGRLVFQDWWIILIILCICHKVHVQTCKKDNPMRACVEVSGLPQKVMDWAFLSLSAQNPWTKLLLSYFLGDSELEWQ